MLNRDLKKFGIKSGNWKTVAKDNIRWHEQVDAEAAKFMTAWAAAEKAASEKRHKKEDEKKGNEDTRGKKSAVTAT